MEKYDVAVIGGGGTGAAAAYDLALRGMRVILFERGELTSGTTGRHHGQLHSGARYALGDVNIARECMAETRILLDIAPDCIEFNKGIFVAIEEDEAALADDFIAACRAASIPAEEIPPAQALAMEGRINPSVRRAVTVPDGTIDAYRLAMSFFSSAKYYGAEIRNFSEVTAIETKGGKNFELRIRNIPDGTDYTVETLSVINAGGPWADRVAALAGADVPVTPAAGTMVAVEGRAANAVVSRLRHPGDGDIIVPQRRLSIIGTTQRKVENPDGLLPPREEIEFLLSAADEMLPGFSKQPFRAAWCAARPLAGRSDGSERSLSRDVVLYDHGRTGTLPGFFSIVGGKATTLRIMGEIAADAAAAHLGVTEKPGTASRGLQPYRNYWRSR
ncbi:FAD-dependent oxidoreductase [Breznakiella homolactica]|uniref:FAD-dependent oxidoreductase n=1 Tax=Breznakiella homolactica TaxID=2798577 RepID=A0A7T7XRU4_9SPIR|nr:FAD-dependent oxidoreductase [Breznakiella homolactica]QQO11274.1 FAD-dependent oxidoreductase [Breznakiella homolactica]